jgi:hypothetical protein
MQTCCVKRRIDTVLPQPLSMPDTDIKSKISERLNFINPLNYYLLKYCPAPFFRIWTGFDIH